MDNRNIRNGNIIRSDGYSDQPYIVKTDDGNWLLTVTTGSGHEGAGGQHVLSMRSSDKGKTWCDEIPVSPPTMPESSYSVMYKTYYGRVYCFYNFNADNLRQVAATDPPFRGGFCTRVDTQGHFVFRFSDDCGVTWSDRWYDIPMRTFEVDRLNPYKGEIKFFWNVGKPLELNDEVFVPLYKIREFGENFMRYSEGVLLHCDNINTERDPEKLNWETLPDGETGIRAPHEISVISEEHSFVPLSDGGVFCVFRTVSGSPWFSYSRDGCRSFSPPRPLTFHDGRKVKHPRAANFIWKCSNGRYLYWFHNHGGRGYEGRNPAWLCGAVEYDSPEGRVLRFGEPQPVLYDPDPSVRMSYPDLVEDDGEYYITETQKTVARIHHIDKALIESLWSESAFGSIPDITAAEGWENLIDSAGRLHLPLGNTFSLRFVFEVPEHSREPMVFSAYDGTDGLLLRQDESHNLELTIYRNGQSSVFVNNDSLLALPGHHVVTAAFDYGVGAVYFVTDGRFCDGGDESLPNSRQYGFIRFDADDKVMRGEPILLPGPDVVRAYVYVDRGLCMYD